MRFPDLVVRLPDWVETFLGEAGHCYPSQEDRMRLVIELARLNLQYKTGGPFGAGIFDLERHTLLAPGVNMVVPAKCSVLHAEIVATIIAQQMVGHFNLGAEGLPPYELVTSTEPCAMCMGSIPWSGVRRLVCGARDEDARSIGFDEGPKRRDWVQEMKSRGIDVVTDVCRPDAVAVLGVYAQDGGMIYNASRALHTDAIGDE